jgi:hypothetical protein
MKNRTVVVPSSNILRIELVQLPKYFVENVKALLLSLVKPVKDREIVYGIFGNGGGEGIKQTTTNEKLEKLRISGEEHQEKEEVPEERGEGCGAKYCDGWGSYECNCMVKRIRG